MKIQTKILAKNPYRGIMKEISIDNGVSINTISQSIKRLNPAILEQVRVKMLQRKKSIRAVQRICNN